MTDSSRPETFTADPSDKRELLIQVWYPAEPSANSVPERFWGQPREIARLLTRSLRLPSFLFDHFTLVKTHSYQDAVLTGARPTYPVLVFSHGYNQGMPTQNTVQMEELASHGYVVFSKAVGNIEAAETKRSLGFHSALTLTPQASADLIRQRVQVALSRLPEFKPLRVQTPVTVDVSFKSYLPAEVLAYLPLFERTDYQCLLIKLVVYDKLCRAELVTCIAQRTDHMPRRWACNDTA
ncbi:MAG: M55 family metallopeptidase [Phycisphaerales bacterium]|nr:M55 family metallopeptidase [Phycisphaerales bacterium]